MKFNHHHKIIILVCVCVWYDDCFHGWNILLTRFFLPLSNDVGSNVKIMSFFSFFGSKSKEKLTHPTHTHGTRTNICQNRIRIRIRMMMEKPMITWNMKHNFSLVEFGEMIKWKKIVFVVFTFTSTELSKNFSFI
mgnify:CR=1 FL=1